MSRHRLVKTMDLDDELDDFDGGEDYDDGEEEGNFPFPPVSNICLMILIEISESDKGQQPPSMPFSATNMHRKIWKWNILRHLDC